MASAEQLDPTEAAFRRDMVMHFELYPNVQLSEATLPAWWKDLGELVQQLPQGRFREVLRRARQASPEKPPTAEQIKTLAEVEAAYEAKARAEHRQERLFPVRELPTTEVIQAFYEACDKAEGELGSAPPVEAQLPVIRGLVVLLSRWYRLSVDDAQDERFAQWCMGEAKRRGLGANDLLAGIRRVPKYCRKAPTIGMVIDLSRGGGVLQGYPSDWVAPAGDLL